MSKNIALSQGKVALVDDTDHQWLSQWKWHYHCMGYAARHIRCNGKRTTIAMHQMILNPPLGLEPDHINGNGLDNRRSNLRLCTRRQNNMNAKKQAGCSSIYKGVSWHKHSRQWRAQIRINSQQHHLGLFNDEREAAIVYDKAALEHFGEFAWLNIIAKEEVSNANV